MDSVPVFNSVQDAVDETGANVALIFVPPPFASDAILEAADAELPLVVCITEGVPVKDSTMVMRYLKDKNTRLLGPNCPGLITPGTGTKIGIMPGNIHMAGKVGVVSRSGTLTYEAVDQLTKLGIGQSTCVGIGGDPVSGTTFLDVLDMFNQDPETEAIVMIGEIGGTKEQEAAAFIKQNIKKPVASLIVGQTAPAGRRMGHAGAVITGKAALASEKMQALKDAGCHVIATPAEIGSTVKAMITG
jgi:succinyl-CoA synthetase alpha subunit